MRLARFRDPDGRIRLGRIDGDTIVPLAATGSDPLLAALQAGIVPAGFEDDGAAIASTDVAQLAPLERPGKIIAIGLNYVDHAAEGGFTPPAEPLTFAKYATSVVGPGDTIRVPATVTTSVDWEAELAFVVGRRCGPDRRGTVDDIAGYTAANDVSARDLQFRDQQWTRAKSIDTFCPLGPVLVTPDELGDPGALRIACRVDGATMQDASTADLVFDVPTLIDFLTATVTLEPGDVVLTGTPPGVGGFRTPPVFLQDGQTVEVEIEGIGVLANPVRHV